jgi:hypothetical protein
LLTRSKGVLPTSSVTLLAMAGFDSVTDIVHLLFAPQGG